MKRLLFLLLFSFSLVSSSFAQRNYMQELIDLLLQGRCFEARELRMQYSDSLPKNDKTLDLIYKSNMAAFFNKPDSAVIYLEELVTNHELTLGPIVGLYYGKLLQIYDDTQQFEKGLELTERIITYFKRNPFDFDIDFAQNEIRSMENAKISFEYRAKNHPRIRIERNNSDETQALKIKTDEYIRFDAKYNDSPIETWFDTGVTAHFIIGRSLADRIGTRMVNIYQDSIQMVNNIPTKVRAELIDSIDLATVKLYNIPVLVFEDGITPNLPDTLNHNERTNVEAVFNDEQIIMGLPTMKLLGKIEFDRKERTVSFPENNVKVESNNLSNIFQINNNSYLKLKVNGLNYVGFLDTGDNDFLSIKFPFYEKNKNHIEIDLTAEKEKLNYAKGTGFFIDISYEIVKDPKVYLNGKLIAPEVYSVIVSDGTISHLDTFDGIIGIGLIKQLGSKLTFDFDNMRLEGE